MSFVGSAYKAFDNALRGNSEPQSSARQPAALPRIPSPVSPSETVATPAKSAEPAAGFLTKDELVRTEPERYGRAIAPPAVSAEVPVKARNLSAVEKSLIAEPVTLDFLVSEFRRAQRITTQRVLLLGALCERWIREQLAKGTALDRATAIKKIRQTLAEARLEKKEARVDLYVRCYWVAVLLGGWTAESADSRAACNELAFSALRLFPILIERSKKDAWSLIEKYAVAAKTLWERAVKERLSAASIDQELSKIVPARTIPIKRHRPLKIGQFLRLATRLPVADVPTAIARLQEMQRQGLLAAEAKAG